MGYDWQNSIIIPSKSFRCGYCGQDIASDKGYKADFFNDAMKREFVYIAICHYCKKPTFLDENGNQFPGSIFGNSIEHLPKNILDLYNESRNCISVNAYTASILCSRKLLMYIAISKGSPPGLPFQKYVDELAAKGFVPPDGKEWVNHIREKGNEATHEITIMSKDDAEDLITFIEMLLKFMYEFPTIMKLKKRVK